MSHEMSVALSYLLAGGVLVGLWVSSVWRWKALKARLATMKERAQ